ncbi:MAG: cysteine desulfurase [Bacteroidales bacterium]|nr:cysteine desulfurase [Bacteroidales bacterium]
MIDVAKVRADFPILNRKIFKKDLVYFDNGATTQKPKSVTDTITRYYLEDNSSIHRGIHYLSGKATTDYEEARQAVASFINAEKKEEVIFTSGATASLNMLAYSFGEKYIQSGDEILVTEMEHHANIVPWQMLCERKGAVLKVIPFNDEGYLQIEKLDELLTGKTKLVSVIHVSNTLGTVNDVEKIIERAHNKDIPVCVDAAQSIQHMPVDVQKLDADFLVFSGHKVYGPTGIGVFYGKQKWLEEMPPWMGGGDMVDEVSFEKTTYNVLPFKFEAGTTNYIGAAGLKSALDYISEIGLENIHQYEKELTDYAMDKLLEIDRMKIFGTTTNKCSVLSFLLEGIHPLDAGMVLDKMGIAVRTGTHCAQPVMKHYGIDGMVRASLSFYNTKEEIDYLCEALKKVIMMFS